MIARAAGCWLVPILLVVTFAVTPANAIIVSVDDAIVLSSPSANFHVVMDVRLKGSLDFGPMRGFQVSVNLPNDPDVVAAGLRPYPSDGYYRPVYDGEDPGGFACGVLPSSGDACRGFTTISDDYLDLQPGGLFQLVVELRANASGSFPITIEQSGSSTVFCPPSSFCNPNDLSDTAPYSVDSGRLTAFSVADVASGALTGGGAGAPPDPGDEEKVQALLLEFREAWIPPEDITGNPGPPVLKPRYDIGIEQRLEIANLVQQWFAPFGVAVVTQPPTGMPFSTVYVGGDQSLVQREWWRFLNKCKIYGIARSVDIGNSRKSEAAIVLAESIADDFFCRTWATGSDEEQVAQVILHEAGHLLGLFHVDDSSQAMHPTPATNRTRFLGATSLYEAPIYRQDSEACLAGSVGPADAVPVPRPCFPDGIPASLLAHASVQASQDMFDVQIGIYDSADLEPAFVSVGDITAGAPVEVQLTLNEVGGHSMFLAAAAEPGGPMRFVTGNHDLSGTAIGNATIDEVGVRLLDPTSGLVSDDPIAVYAAEANGNLVSAGTVSIQAPEPSRAQLLGAGVLVAAGLSRYRRRRWAR